MRYATILDLGRNELQNAVIQNLTVAPSSPLKGQIYFDSTDGVNKLRVFNGTDFEIVDNIDSISGGTGISLSGTGKDPIISLATVGTAGTYTKTTVDAYGRVTGGSTPTTLAGYSITDAMSTAHAANSITGFGGAPAALAAAAAAGTSTLVARADHAHALPTLNALSNVTITSIASGEILKWNGSAWINNTLEEAGIQPAGSYLTGNQTITVSGDATGSGSTAIALTLANSGVSAGTYTKVTVDAKGRVTSASNLSAGDIPTIGSGQISGLGSAASKDVGTASGQIPILDASGKLDTNVLPAIAITDTFVVASQVAMLALDAQTGDVAVRTDENKSYILKGSSAATLANWELLRTPTDLVTSVAGKTGAVTLTSSDVGLGNVTNESKATMFSSAALTGTPTAPTASAATNNTQIATTAFVKAQGYLTSSTGVTSFQTSLAGLTPSTASNGAVTLGGTLGATSGGTGLSSYAVGDLLYASSTTAVGKLADVATGNVLLSGGVGVAPSYGKVGLTTHVTGTLAVGNGGTGLTSITSKGVMYGNGASAVGVTAAGTEGQVLVANASGVPTFATLDLTYMPDSAFKKSVKVATTANITLSGTQTIDGVAVVAGDRVLVKNQSAASANGIYIVAAGAWTRATSADTAIEVAGGVVAVDSGTQGGQLFTNYFKSTDTLGTTAMDWYRIYSDLDSSTANTGNKLVLRDGSGNFSAGTITATLSGNASTASKWATARTITLGGDLSGSVSIDGSSNVTLTATVADSSHSHSEFSTFMKRYAATIGDGTTKVYTVTHNLGTTDVQVQVRDVASPMEFFMADVRVIDANSVSVIFSAAPLASSVRVVVMG